MNLLERIFADLTGDCIRDGNFPSVRERIDAVEEYLADRNANPKRYVWQAKREEILRKIAKVKDVPAVQSQPSISNTRP
jgi:hypothetical protein